MLFKIEDPAYLALFFNASSILNNWLYFAVLSVLDRDPVLICPAETATDKSAIVVSSVSPDLCEIIEEMLGKKAKYAGKSILKYWHNRTRSD